MKLSEAPGRAAVGLLFATVLLDVLGLSLLYPVAAYLVLRYGGNGLMVTLLTVLYAAAQCLASPVLGRLGDVYGRRPVLLFCLCGSLVGYLVLGVGGALWVLFTARLISGACSGSQSVASAALLDLSTPANRAARLALIGSAWGIGLVIGPAAGAALGQWRLDAPAFVAAGLSALSAGLCFLYLPETLPRTRRAARRPGPPLNPFAPVLAFVRRPGLSRFLLAMCLFTAAFQGIGSVETLYFIHAFAVKPWQLGVMLAAGGVCTALIQYVAAPLVRRAGERRVAQLSLLLLALGALAIGSAASFWLAALLGTLRTTASALVFPTIGALVTRKVAPNEFGSAMGVNTALASLMGVVGPLAAGAVYDSVTPSAPYWLGALVFAAAGAVLLQRVKTGSARARRL